VRSGGGQAPFKDWSDLGPSSGTGGFGDREGERKKGLSFVFREIMAGKCAEKGGSVTEAVALSLSTGWPSGRKTGELLIHFSGVGEIILTGQRRDLSQVIFRQGTKLRGT